jgi:F420-dependent oxidoreductase-like protein
VARLAAFNTPVRTIDESVARAKTVERLGFESIWTTQLPDARDVSLALAAYATATEKVRLATGVLPIYTRHPTAMVQMAATLDELSKGRFILGIGVSHKVVVEGRWGLTLDRPVDAMREYVTIVRTSLTEGSCDFAGDHFTARWSYSGPRRAEMPIMISALNPRMLELAGELADGVVLWMCSPGYISTSVLPYVEAGRKKAGKSLEGFEVVAAVPVCLTSDRAAGLAVFKQTVHAYSNLPFYRRMMDASGFKAELEAGNVSDAMLDELAGIGDESRVRDAVKRYREAGVTLPAVGPFGGHQGAAGFEKTLEAVGGA